MSAAPAREGGAGAASAAAVGGSEAEGSAVRTIFFGSGSFAVPILEALRTIPGVDPVAVVSAPDRPAGRHEILTPTPVTASARSAGLPVLQPVRVRRPEAVVEIEALRPDLAVLADYGQLIPNALLDLPPRGFLNVHPSVLPRHRGAAPIPATILAGDRQAAVTLMVVTEEMDAGPILAVEPLEVRPDDIAPELEARAAQAGARLVRRAIPEWLAGLLPPRAQLTDGVTYTRPLRREDGRLDPSRSAEELERQIRAYQPWPGSYVETPQGRLIVWRAAVCPSEPGDDAGRLVGAGAGLALTTANGRLRLDEVQLAGRRRMPSEELRRGYAGLAGAAVR